MMPVGQALEPDREFDVARSNDVLYLELCKLRIEAKLFIVSTRVYLRLASLTSSSDFAPVTTILPDAKMRAVVLSSRMRITAAAKRLENSQKELTLP